MHVYFLLLYIPLITVITVLIVLTPYNNIVLLLPHSLHFISLITTTNTYTCTFYILIISTLLTSTAASPNSVHITYLFLTVHIYLFIHLLHFTYAHTLHFFAILHFWLDAKLHFVVSVLVLCAMTIKLNLI